MGSTEEQTPSGGAKPPPYKDPDDGKQRFLLELEFVQCLANPTYIHLVADGSGIRTAFSFLSSYKMQISGMQWHIQQARNNRLKHILPRPPPEPTPLPAPAPAPATASPPAPVPAPAVPPVPAPPSSLPPMAAGGASAMTPMQFVGTPGTNIPKNDMRNVMGGRKRKKDGWGSEHASQDS